MSIVCEEVFDESSHPSIDEIRDYATKIGIDPDSEPLLLPLAAEGLMKALPPGWKPCYEDKSKSYYYYNNLTGKTQWEHPLDDVYRGIVRKVRAESQSLSLGEPTEDATYARDDLPSFEEPPLQLPTPISEIKKPPPIKTLPQIKSLIRHKSENELLEKKISLNIFNSLGEETNFDKHPRSVEKTDLKITGNGTMFLKTNTKKQIEVQPKKSILREVSEIDKSVEVNDEKDNKSVRFTLDNNSSTDNLLSDEKDEIIDKKPKSRFIVSPVKETELLNLKLIKPNPDDFLKLTNIKESDSEDESHQKSPPINDLKQMEQLKQNIWVEKNEELLKFKDDLQESHKEELKRILINEKTIYEDRIKTELDSLRIEMENRNTGTIKEEIEHLEKELQEKRQKLQDEYCKKEKLIREKYENKKNDLEKYYEKKFLENEKELVERIDKLRNDLIFTHNSDIEQLKQNHSIILEELKKTYKAEEDQLRQQHKSQMTELRNNQKVNDLDKANKIDEKLYEKIKCEKRLLDDKYRCLKEKYLRLKTDVKLTIEKKNKKKEQSCTTTTGSETERSFSNKISTPLNSPLKKPLKNKPENKVTRQLIIQDMDFSTSDNKNDENKNDYESSDNNSNTNPGRSRKKLFSRLKSSSTSRISNNQNLKTRNQPQQQRSCSPVENLRRQLQKLEDLEDEFPQNAQIIDTTYHLRYPFTSADLQKLDIGPGGGNCCSELEFFRHRVHLERDSIKRAKESLRSQKILFQQRQKELKLQHGSMARHTLQQLCQEEKELTDMEVNLHRTRSLLGEKVIRLRHLEASLQRATTVATNPDQIRHHHQDTTAAAAAADVTLSDLSSHSASSGISSTEFATAPDRHHLFIQEEQIRESSEIIQSLENLNSEIREIWDVLRKQHQTAGMNAVITPLLYPDLGWPLLAGTASGTSTAAVPAPPSIPTLADRLHNYRQQVALANAQSTMVTHASNQGATTTLVERTRNLRHWLRQAGIDSNLEGNSPQAM